MAPLENQLRLRPILDIETNLIQLISTSNSSSC